MIEGASPLGKFYGDEEDIAERLGHRDPPVGISLFTGAGGFDLGMEWAGIDVRVMVENMEEACDTLRMNMEAFSDHTEPTIIEDDIREVSTRQILKAADVGVGEATVVFGGPPCQGFSMSGKRDPDDERNALYQEMVRIVNEAKPLYFVMENVKGLVSMEGGDVIRRVCREFADCGYNVNWDVLNAADYGVPQRRERTFVMGKRVDVMAPGLFGPDICIAAVPGRVDHPEFFCERHGLNESKQATLDTFADEPETLREALENMVKEGVTGAPDVDEFTKGDEA